MDTPQFNKFRIAPTTQQGGTQTIQQAIYLTHNNPCGANLLIYQEMGLTQIRYIDLKNYLDAILDTETMRLLFEDIRIAATNYINNPADDQLLLRYLYTIMKWSQQGILELPVSVYYYKGYKFRVDTYDGSGTCYYDSFYPILQIIEYNTTKQLYGYGSVPITPAQGKLSRVGYTNLYKMTSAPRSLPFINADTSTVGYAAYLSNFLFNQNSMLETEMTVASLLIDSANTRTFGIPKYGFSARQNVSQFSGITYNCSHYIDIQTMPDENGHTTLVESIFFRLSLVEDTYNFTSSTTSRFFNSSLSTSLSMPMSTEELMMQEEYMGPVVRAINDDLQNLETNMELIRTGREDELFLMYFEQLFGSIRPNLSLPQLNESQLMRLAELGINPQQLNEEDFTKLKELGVDEDVIQTYYEQFLENTDTTTSDDGLPAKEHD